MSDQNYLLSITGMSCSGCVSSVKAALIGIAGVESVTINLSEGTAVVAGDVPVERLVKAVKDAGYDASKLNLTTE